jgi:hypothetical protein
MASSDYSTASPFTTTNSAEAYSYEELMGLFLSFSKARVGGATATWTKENVLSKMDELVRSLRGLARVLGSMDPRLHFVRKGRRGYRHEIDAEAAISAHEAAMRVLNQRFTEFPTSAMFGKIQDYIAEELASDVEKLQRRHTRVILGKSARLSSNAPPTESESSGSGSGSGSDSSGYASYGGARRRATRKKLTRRRR